RHLLDEAPHAAHGGGRADQPVAPLGTAVTRGAAQEPLELRAAHREVEAPGRPFTRPADGGLAVAAEEQERQVRPARRQPPEAGPEILPDLADDRRDRVVGRGLAVAAGNDRLVAQETQALAESLRASTGVEHDDPGAFRLALQHRSILLFSSPQ